MCATTKSFIYISKVVFDIHTNNPSRQYFRERLRGSDHDTKHFALDFVRFLTTVFDSPIDHFRHYGLYTGVGRHSHLGVGEAWLVLFPTIGVLHVRCFSCSVTNSSFVFRRICGCSSFRHQSGHSPLFLTTPTNHGNPRYPFIGHSLMHILDWCIIGCFLWFYPLSFSLLPCAATRIQGSVVISVTRLFFLSTTCTTASAISHRPGRGF